MNGHYDAIVLGLGGVGSAAAAHFAGRGLKVLGLEQFGAAHDRGSSHGRTRAIRQAYFEDPAYVPLLRRAYQLWSELEAEVGRQLFFRVGLLEIGSPAGPLVGGVQRSAQEHQLQVELLTPSACGAEFPQFVCPPESVAVFEPHAGYLLVEECVRAHLDLARRLGADLKFQRTARQWNVRNGTIVLRTDTDVFQAERLIITAGPWAADWLPRLPLQVLRKQVYWFPACDAIFSANCPVYLFELPDGLFYGFPALDEAGVKVGEHTGGAPVPGPSPEPAEDPDDCERVCRFVGSSLRGVVPEPGRRSTCWYTMSPDGHFRLQHHPDHPQVLFAAGLSGHGFKFAPVLGEILADLALAGATRHPIGLFQS